MSIRVHKLIGYGVTNFKPNPQFLLDYEKLMEMKPQKFLQWAAKHIDKILALRSEDHMAEVIFRASLKDKITNYNMSSFFTWEGEFGIPNVFVVSPFEIENRWKRFNDDIDWLEETIIYGQKNRVVVLEKDIHPYPKGKPPLMVGAILQYLNLENYWDNLEELLYVYWA